MGEVNLTGRWLGFYRHRWDHLRPFALSANLSQEGTRVTGEMFDQHTNWEEMAETLLERCREEITEKQKVRLERVIQHYGAGAVAIGTTLPEVSVLGGSVKGTKVEFIKSYLGTLEYKWKVDGRHVGSQTVDNHKIKYSGDLDVERGCIIGEWTIKGRGLLGQFLPPIARGTFELYRKSLSPPEPAVGSPGSG